MAKDFSNMKITFIGGGNMACALIGGLLRQGYEADNLKVVEISPGACEKITQEFNVAAIDNLREGLPGCDVLLLAVKPQQLLKVAGELAPLLANQLVISIAAGIRANDVSRWMRGHERIVRAMPNTPALIGLGVTGLYALPGVSLEEKRHAEAILATVGSTLWLEDEESLDALTAISGSGPAYVFYFIESMQQAAQELGLDPAQARSLSLQTFLGASTLAASGKEDAATLRARVTSPGGTTERAVRVLESKGVKSAIIGAAHAARLRSRELANEFGKT
jgi:pyrroline-5-carboxylate reductase